MTLIRRLDLRPDRPAADPRGGRRVRRRSRRGRLRAPGRPAARLAPLRRELGPALARPGPLRRDQRLRARLGQAVRLAVSRLRHRRVQRDKPYDQFIREQLAGDEIDPGSAEALIATGFYRLGIWDDEPADRPLARYDGLDGVISTTGQVFLGMTVNCARCHDHKVDPIPQTDYYRLLAFFSDVDRSRRQEPEEGRPGRGRHAIEVMCVAERRPGRDARAACAAIPTLPGDKVEPGVPEVLERRLAGVRRRAAASDGRWRTG